MVVWSGKDVYFCVDSLVVFRMLSIFGYSFYWIRVVVFKFIDEENRSLGVLGEGSRDWSRV